MTLLLVRQFPMGNFNDLAPSYHGLTIIRSFPEKSAKRFKQDILSDAPQPQRAVNGTHSRQNILSRLKVSVAKAQRSVDDLRSMRESTERRYFFVSPPYCTITYIHVIKHFGRRFRILEFTVRRRYPTTGGFTGISSTKWLSAR
jgi:hypothetical protein